MAQFSATHFTFDGISSKNFLGTGENDCLLLCHVDEGGGFKESDLPGFEPIWNDNINNRRSYFYGTEVNSKLTFDITVAALRPLTRQEINKIYSWLSLRRKLCWLEIDQEDMNDVRFRCVLTEGRQTSMANYPYALTFTVVCDSPFAWSYPVISTFRVGGIVRLGDNILLGDTNITLGGEMGERAVDADLLEMADVDWHVSPKITVSAKNENNLPTYISIANVQDGDVGLVIDLSADDGDGVWIVNETITIDNERKIISSSEGRNRFVAFNKKWLKLYADNNEIAIATDGECEVTFEYSYPVMPGV